MKTDRELLELAAKAAGLDGYEWDETPFDRGLYKRNFEPCGLELQTQSFNPMDNDGDALRLAVALDMQLGSCATADLSGASWAECGLAYCAQEHEGDALAATRRAIVRAAAAIGEAMP